MESNKHLNGYAEEEDDYETENRGAIYYDHGVSKRTYFPTCRYCHNQTLPTRRTKVKRRQTRRQRYVVVAKGRGNIRICSKKKESARKT